MHNVPVEERLGSLEGFVQRMGRTLLCFAAEERRLDSDATFEAWAAAGDTCWKDTEQQCRPMALAGLPQGVSPVVGDGAFVQVMADPASTAGAGRISTGDGAQGLGAFHTEIDRWRQRRDATRRP